MWDLGSGHLTTTAGVYKSTQTVEMFWNFVNTFKDVAGGGRNALLDLTTATGTALSKNGVFGFAFPTAFYHTDYDVRYKFLGPYGSVNYQLSQLSLGASLRWDRGKVSGNVTSPDFGQSPPTTAAVDVNGDGTLSLPESKVAILTLGKSGTVAYDCHAVSYSAGLCSPRRLWKRGDQC